MKVITESGAVFELGVVATTPTIGITDYSKRETDDFGVTTVVERTFARRMSVQLAVPFADVDVLQRRLADLRATPATWIADDRFASLSIRGFYKDFSLDIGTQPLSYCTLTVEGLAEAAAPVDAGGDPAPAGLSSTLQLLQPITIDDDVLTASNVIENDTAGWSSTTSYPAGARVMETATHRIYESLVNANAGNDPVARADKWLDVGPTNRWAMFDQALGTVTMAARSIVVTLDTGIAAPVAIALLDVSAAKVRVQATGYDRTTAAGVGAITFLDLPAGVGAVTVTISGSDTVSVGTLMIGQLVGLGITETSPTVGITDYSKKTTDDFGDVTIVPRSWAKSMSAKALIRTDGVDLVAARIAAVRARPSLWIGQAGTDSLTVYGFFKDFTVEIGETVSKLSLSIEGLSEAAKLAPLTAAIDWPNVGDPDGTKPADNADKTSENTSKDTAAVSGRPAGQILSGIDDLKKVFGDTVNAAASADAAAGYAVTSRTAADQSAAARAAAQDAQALASTQAGLADAAKTAAAASRDAAANASTLAGNAKDAAAVSATTASSAQGAAVAARDAAQTARTDAQTAQGAATAKAQEAQQSATGAAGSASTASGQATIATQKATDAGASASTATAKADIATTKAAEAVVSASHAATSETTAAGSASTATTQANLSTTARGQAEGFATAASGSASTAASKASDAGTSAAASSTARDAAQTAKGQADASATRAATSESNALGSANAASSSAGVSASARDGAKSAALTLMPSTFEQESLNWSFDLSGAAGTQPDMPTGNVRYVTTTYGKSAEFFGSVASPTTKARLRAVPGRTYRVTIFARAIITNPVTTYSNLFIIGNTPSNMAEWSSLAVWTIVMPADGTWTKQSFDWTCDRDAYLLQRADVNVGPNNTYSGNSTRVNILALEDVTAEVKSAASASAAATSASNASASAYGSDQSAQAANANAVNADTYAGQALSYRNEAAVSRDSASGSAQTATQQAGVATTAKTDAQAAQGLAAGSASAASGSASTATSKASEAGTSAAAALADRQLAQTARGQADASATRAATSESSALGSANSASSSAGVSATARDAAKVSALALMPSNFEQESLNWTFDLTGVAGTQNDMPASATRYVSTSYGKSLEVFGSIGSPTTKARLRGIPGRTYRVTILARVVVSNPVTNYANVFIIGNTPSNMADWYSLAVWTIVLPADGTWTKQSFDWTCDRDVFLLQRADVNIGPGNSYSGNMTRINILSLEDVTGEVKAVASAGAAATSASTAAASAYGADQSAIASTTSATNANTSAGQAQGYRNDAAASASNAAGSAQTATTQAGLATTAKGLAQGFADAASGSASAASAKASDAASAASAATGARDAAQTAKGLAEAASTRAATSESNASGSANAASTSASTSATARDASVAARDAASASASAASTSASNAAASTSTAGQASSAATAARDAAQTAKGQAEAAQGRAATSADNAAGSASSAATSSAASASSASKAEGFANAASTQASNAQTQATNAGISATAASTSANNALTYQGGAQQAAGTASSAAAAANASQSSTSAFVTQASSFGFGSLNRNAVFAAPNWDVPSNPAINQIPPPFWSMWGFEQNYPTTSYVGPGNTPSVYGNHVLRMERSGINVGILQAFNCDSAGWYVMEAEVMVYAGNWRGTGMLCNFSNTGVAFNFATEADTSLMVNSAEYGTKRKFSKMFLKPNHGGQTTVYAMAGWEGFASAGAATTLWEKCHVRPATQGEIDGRQAKIDAANNAARISQVSETLTTNFGALATRTSEVEARAGGVESRTAIVESAVATTKSQLAAARLELSATSPGGRASVVIRSDSNGGAGVDLVGDVRISGGLMVDGTITSKKVATSAVQQTVFAILPNSISIPYG